MNTDNAMIDHLDRRTAADPGGVEFYEMLVHEIARDLSEPTEVWTDARTDSYVSGPGSYPSPRYPVYHLSHDDEVVTVQLDGGPAYDHLRIGVYHNGLNLYNLTGKNVQDIKVSANKSSVAIAKDIKRRLLPEARELIAKAKAEVQKRQDTMVKYRCDPRGAGGDRLQSLQALPHRGSTREHDGHSEVNFNPSLWPDLGRRKAQ